ncbi:MAG: EamA family transporter, partial [Planctomycetia bacterium]
VGLALGEPSRLLERGVTTTAVLGFVYLTIAGSLITFPVYTWLLKVAPPALVGTYAFVNPLVAVTLGVSLDGERFDATAVGAGLLVLTAVALVAWGRKTPTVVQETKEAVVEDGSR